MTLPTTYLHEFADGQAPMNALLMDANGVLYGISADLYSKPSSGTVYEIAPQ